MEYLGRTYTTYWDFYNLECTPIAKFLMCASLPVCYYMMWVVLTCA